jgi:CP family cyanate transporter-like MFS transporter
VIGKRVASGPESPPGRLSGRELGSLALLWLGGFDLRATVLAVPPVIPAIHRSLGLDEKGISILTALPTLLLALAAVPGALLIARVGARRALLAGLGLIAVGSALRGIGPHLVLLFAMTAVMGAGVAVSQPVFPTLAREWFPARVALATAVYSNGLIFGELIPASFTGPWLFPLLGHSWPLVFLAWAAPALLALVLLAALTRHVPQPPLARWWPDFRDARLWRVGLVMGFASAAYFGTNAFVPDFVTAIGQPSLANPALAALNTSQLAASLLVLTTSRHLVGRRWPFAAAGLLIGAAAAGLALAPSTWTVAFAGVIGFATAFVLVLTLALPPLLAAPDDVPRFSAGAFLIIYLMSFLGPLAGGAVWDASGLPATAFAVLGVGGLVGALLSALGQLRPWQPRPRVGGSP